MAYYVTRGRERYSERGVPLETEMKKYESLVKARAYAIRLVSQTRNHVGFFIDPKTKKRWGVGLDVVFILKTKDGDEIGTVQYGQPNLAYEVGYYWHTWEKSGISHWSLLNKDGTVKKKYR